MNKKLLLVLIMASGCFALPTKDLLQKSPEVPSYGFLKQISSLLKHTFLSDNTDIPVSQIKDLLQQQADSLHAEVIAKVVASIECIRARQIPVKNILTVIDYSLPSNQKRLWVFDLENKRLLYHTYVSHGLTSGSVHTEFFSNKFDSKASSIGVYTTEKSYYGREGLSLRLHGLDRGFNDNAQNRYIVMHGGWYMNEGFIQKYGRPGRSWGCPAMPREVSGSIINTIKENNLMVVYYPDEKWLSSSKFLNCRNFSMMNDLKKDNGNAQLLPAMQHEPILYLDLNKNNKREEHEPVLVMEASQYQRVFNNSPPLTRMIRKQIDNQEYIALTRDEFNKMILNKNLDSANDDSFSHLHFIVPVLKNNRGYYQTEMHRVEFGKITHAKLDILASETQFIIDFEKKPAVNMKATGQFIRWLGL